MNSNRKHRLSLAVAFAMMGVCTVAQPRILNKPDAAPSVQAEHWYSIRAAAEGAPPGIEVYIYGEIGYWGYTSGDFVREVSALDDGVSPITVAFDSIGGDLFDGIAIHNYLNRLGERCTARIDGACYSAASVAASGAHRVLMADNALFMIHNPWTFAAGDAADLRKLADMMDKAAESIVTSYMRRPLTIDDTELRRLITEETWLTAPEAKQLGFVDEVLAGDQPKFNNSRGKILNRYQHTPQAALDLLTKAAPEPAPTPEPEPEITPDPVPEDDPVADPVALAAQLAADCKAAGLGNVTEALIKASGLKSQAAIKAEFVRAKAVHDLCVLAKLPDESAALIIAGADVEGARAQLLDKVVAASGKVEISNKPPLDETLPAPSKAADPGAIYASRKPNASKGARK
ncbi:MAG: head maturation protease, ClpP-related [Pseudomonas sp.]